MISVLTLILIGLVSGIVTGLSPCVLPVLPVVLTTSAAGPLADPNASPDGRTSRARPFLVVAGLVTSFAVFTLAGGALLAALGLPQDLLRNLGIGLMVAVGIGFLIPAVSHWLERPFARLPKADARKQSSAFLFGAVFGLVFVPCAGPVLATITVVAASHSVGWQLIVLTVSFALGVAIPLLAIAVAGQRMTERIAVLRRRMPLIRQVTGVVLIVTAAAVAFNVTDVFQRLVPGYVSAAQSRVESSKTAKDALSSITHHTNAAASGQETARSFDDCSNDPTQLHNCGVAPDFRGIGAWLNTPGNRPLTLKSLRGKVVLVDFWTYSCINCQRTLPYLEAWDKAYRNSGLVIVGIHTPEFAFEHVVSNVRSQSKALGVRYAVAVDDNFDTWNAYSQQYWPAHYLIDRQGIVRQVHYGEGEYGATETLIRKLLAQKATKLPTNTKVVAPIPMAGATPETYLGSERASSYVNTNVAPGTNTYQLSPSLPEDQVSLGGTWDVTPQYIEAGDGARLALNYSAGHVYLVLGGSGRVQVRDGGRVLPDVIVRGAPTLYQLRAGPAHRSVLSLSIGKGVRAYSFTFG